MAAPSGVSFAPRLRCVFSISTVASSTSIPTASANPPSDMTLMVWPSADRLAIENRIASGIDVHTISVLHQLPHGSFHDQRLIEQRYDGQRARQHRLDARQSGLYLVYDRDGRKSAVLDDCKQGRWR